MRELFDLAVLADVMSFDGSLTSVRSRHSHDPDQLDELDPFNHHVRSSLLGYRRQCVVLEGQASRLSLWGTEGLDIAGHDGFAMSRALESLGQDVKVMILWEVRDEDCHAI